MNRHAYRIFLVISFLILSNLSAHAARIAVTNTNDSGPGSLRYAIGTASIGDSISFQLPAGSTITLTSGQLVINKDLTITGPGPAALTVSGNSTSRVFYVQPLVSVSISGLTLSSGSAMSTICGGGIHNQGILSLTNVTVSGNLAQHGGGICNEGGGRLTISNSTISGNSARISGDVGGFGGGIYSSLSNLTISNSTISGNFAEFLGAGVYVSNGISSIINSTVSSNSGAYQGGGFYNVGESATQATLTITGSTLNGNSAPCGAGVNYGTGTLVINNSTISENSAPSGVGGICNVGFNGTATIAIGNSTFGQNTGFSIYNGGGFAGASVQIRGTVFANPAGGNLANESGTITSQGYNLSHDSGAGFLTGPGDQINTDPLLGPLQNNGGPTFTHALLAGSPAIDAGDPNFVPPPDYDQRGFARIADGNRDGVARIDIGSFEAFPNPTISGRVLKQNGMGISRAKVTLTDAQGNIRTVLTDGQGNYRFLDVPPGQSYLLQAEAKRYRFEPIPVTVNQEDLVDINFVALP